MLFIYNNKVSRLRCSSLPNWRDIGRIIYVSKRQKVVDHIVASNLATTFSSTVYHSLLFTANNHRCAASSGLVSHIYYRELE